MDVFFQKRNERWAPCSESQTIWHVTSYPWSLRRSKHGECKLHTPANVILPKYYKYLKKNYSAKPFGQIRMPVFDRISCISSKNLRTETIKQSRFFILNSFNLECIFSQKTWKVKEITHDLNHDLTFYCKHNQLCVPQYKVNV